MDSLDERVDACIVWAQHNLPGMRHAAAEVVADELGDALLRVDDGLGVEVEDEEGADREVIVTAFSNRALFGLVYRIVDALSRIEGWRFVALKPPRGFAFALTVGEHRIEAKTLGFRGLPEVEGIELLMPPSVPAPVGDNAQELAWLVVETGLGEELAGALRHIEFSSDETASGGRAIEQLEAYVREALSHG